LTGGQECPSWVIDLLRGQSLPRAERLAAALWHYTDTPIARPYHVRGYVPEPDDAAMSIALWSGPSARDQRNLSLLVPLVSGGLPVPSRHVVAGLMRLGRGTHLFVSVGRRFDGRFLLEGSGLVQGEGRPCPACATVTRNLTGCAGSLRAPRRTEALPMTPEQANQSRPRPSAFRL
jgi:hypothetical protein